MTDTEKEELSTVAASFPDMTVSQLVREAIREKVAELKKKLAATEEGAVEVAAGT